MAFIPIPEGKTEVRLKDGSWVKIPEGVTEVDSSKLWQQTETPQSNSQQDEWDYGGPVPQRKSEMAPTEEPSFLDKVSGAIDAGTYALGAIPAGLIGTPVGAIEGLYDTISKGQYGTAEGARNVENIMGERIESLNPATIETELGQKYLQNIGETLSPLEALTPMIGAPERAMQAGLKQGINQTKAGIDSLRAVPTKVENKANQGLNSIKTKAGEMAEELTTDEKVKLGEKYGVSVMTSDVYAPKTWLGKYIQSSLEKIPVTGTGDMRKVQYKERVDAIQNFLNKNEISDSDYMLTKTMESLKENHAKIIDKNARIKKNIFDKINDKGNVDTKNTVNAIDEQITQLKSVSEKDYSGIINQLETLKNDIKDGLDIKKLDERRQLFGDILGGDEYKAVKRKSQKVTNEIYNVLNNDIGEFIKANTKDGYTKWQQANKALSNLFKEQENRILKSVLKSGDTKPEDIKKMLFSKDTSTVKSLMKNLDSKGRANAKGALLSKIAEESKVMLPEGESLSVQKFISNIKRYEKSTGIILSKDDKKVLDGLVEVLNLTKRSDEATTMARTGEQLNPILQFGAATAITGDVFTGGLLTLSLGKLGQLFEKGAVRNTLMKITNLPDNIRKVIASDFIKNFMQKAEDWAEKKINRNDPNDNDPNITTFKSEMKIKGNNKLEDGIINKNTEGQNLNKQNIDSINNSEDLMSTIYEMNENKTDLKSIIESGKIDDKLVEIKNWESILPEVAPIAKKRFEEITNYKNEPKKAIEFLTDKKIDQEDLFDMIENHKFNENQLNEINKISRTTTMDDFINKYLGIEKKQKIENNKNDFEVDTEYFDIKLGNLDKDGVWNYEKVPFKSKIISNVRKWEETYEQCTEIKNQYATTGKGDLDEMFKYKGDNNNAEIIRGFAIKPGTEYGDMINNLKVGDEFSENVPSSASHLGEDDLAFYATNAKDNPNDTTAFFVYENVSDNGYNIYGQVKEVIIKPNTKFKVKEIDNNFITYDYNTGDQIKSKRIVLEDISNEK